MPHRFAPRSLPLVAGLVATPALAQDGTTLRFDWPDGFATRVVYDWELDVIAPDGTKRTSGGLVREVWTIRRTPEGWRLDASDRSVVRTGAKDDPVARGVTAALSAPWSVRFTPELAVPPDPTEAAPPMDAAPEAAAEGAAAPPALPADTLLDDGALVELVVGDRARWLERLFTAFAGQTVPLGRDQRSDAGLVSPGTGAVDVAEVLRRVDGLSWCPDVGPGSSCVELKLVRAYGGADTANQSVLSGQRRELERWIVEPATLLPHHAEAQSAVARSDASGGRWSYAVARRVHFLPLSEPATPVAERAPER